MDLSINDLASLAGWAYLLIAAVAAGDAVLPILPSEVAVIFGAVLAGRGDLSLVAVIVVAAVGATIGDNVSYQLGSAANRKGKDPEDLSGKVGAALGWAEAALDTHGFTMIMVARFIPGGRTAITFGSGYLGYSRWRFLGATVLAGSVWAVYAAMLGVIGGTVFRDRWWAAVLLGVAVSLAVSGVIELVRRVRGGGDSISERRDEIQAERADD
ncbi:MAG: DedA family protein [Acidimicrobiales bacterium]